MVKSHGSATVPSATLFTGTDSMRAAMDGWMDPIGNQHLDLGNEQSPYRDGRRIPRR